MWSPAGLNDDEPTRANFAPGYVNLRNYEEPAMIKVKQLAHVCIFANDLDETRRFYEDVLGIDIQFKFPARRKDFRFLP